MIKVDRISRRLLGGAWRCSATGPIAAPVRQRHPAGGRRRAPRAADGRADAGPGGDRVAVGGRRNAKPPGSRSPGGKASYRGRMPGTTKARPHTSTTRPDRPYPPSGVESPTRGEGDDLTDAGNKPLAHPVRPGPGGGHAPPYGGRHPRRPPRAAPPHPPRDRRQGRPRSPPQPWKASGPSRRPTARPGRRGGPSRVRSGHSIRTDPRERPELANAGQVEHLRAADGGHTAFDYRWRSACPGRAVGQPVDEAGDGKGKEGFLTDRHAVKETTVYITIATNLAINSCVLSDSGRMPSLP